MKLYVQRELGLGSRLWHIARYAPTGYGIRTLCGLLWLKDSYRTSSGADGPVCKSCRKRSDEDA